MFQETKTTGVFFFRSISSLSAGCLRRRWVFCHCHLNAWSRLSIVSNNSCTFEHDYHYLMKTLLKVFFFLAIVPSSTRLYVSVRVNMLTSDGWVCTENTSKMSKRRRNAFETMCLSDFCWDLPQIVLHDRVIDFLRLLWLRKGLFWKNVLVIR